jgi:hypothetical protein
MLLLCSPWIHLWDKSTADVFLADKLGERNGIAHLGGQSEVRSFIADFNSQRITHPPVKRKQKNYYSFLK